MGTHTNAVFESKIVTEADNVEFAPVMYEQQKRQCRDLWILRNHEDFLLPSETALTSTFNVKMNIQFKQKQKDFLLFS